MDIIVSDIHLAINDQKRPRRPERRRPVDVYTWAKRKACRLRAEFQKKRYTVGQAYLIWGLTDGWQLTSHPQNRKIASRLNGFAPESRKRRHRRPTSQQEDCNYKFIKYYSCKEKAGLIEDWCNSGGADRDPLSMVTEKEETAVRKKNCEFDWVKMLSVKYNCNKVIENEKLNFLFGVTWITLLVALELHTNTSIYLE